MEKHAVSWEFPQFCILCGKYVETSEEPYTMPLANKLRAMVCAKDLLRPEIIGILEEPPSDTSHGDP